MADNNDIAAALERALDEPEPMPDAPRPTPVTATPTAPANPQPPPPAPGITFNPANIRDPAFRANIRRTGFNAAVQRYITLAYQTQWALETNNALPAALPRVTPADCPLQYQSLGSQPFLHLDLRRPSDPTSLLRIAADITDFVQTTGDTPAPWSHLLQTMEQHWSHLPPNLPHELSPATQRAKWNSFNVDPRVSLAHVLDADHRAVVRARKIDLAWHFFHSNLQLVATLALAERRLRTTDDEEGEENSLAAAAAAPSSIYKALATKMQHERDNNMLNVCERIATGLALPLEEEELLSCLPVPEEDGGHVRRELGRTPEVTRLGRDRELAREMDVIEERERAWRRERDGEARFGMVLTEEDAERMGGFGGYCRLKGQGAAVGG